MGASRHSLWPNMANALPLKRNKAHRAKAMKQGVRQEVERPCQKFQELGANEAAGRGKYCLHPLIARSTAIGGLTLAETRYESAPGQDERGNLRVAAARTRAASGGGSRGRGRRAFRPSEDFTGHTRAGRLPLPGREGRQTVRLHGNRHPAKAWAGTACRRLRRGERAASPRRPCRGGLRRAAPAREDDGMAAYILSAFTAPRHGKKSAETAFCGISPRRERTERERTIA